MTSFSRRRIVATTIQRISEPAREASHAAETEEDGTIQSADQSATPAAEPTSGGDVDFDIEIAEVLMTLATGPGTAGDARPIVEREETAALAQLERHDDSDLDDEGAPDSDDDAGDDDDTSDPEALLAAEAATFRLLGELDRLWHRAA
jgi:hypothetical protein